MLICDWIKPIKMIMNKTYFAKFDVLIDYTNTTRRGAALLRVARVLRSDYGMTPSSALINLVKVTDLYVEYLLHRDRWYKSVHITELALLTEMDLIRDFNNWS